MSWIWGQSKEKESTLPGGRKHLIWGPVASKCAVSGDKRWEESRGDKSLVVCEGPAAWGQVSEVLPELRAPMEAFCPSGLLEKVNCSDSA